MLKREELYENYLRTQPLNPYYEGAVDALVNALAVIDLYLILEDTDVEAE